MEIHCRTLNVQEPDEEMVEITLHKVDTPKWKENIKLISAEDLLKRYIPEDPLLDVELHISPNRKSYSGKNPCIICGKELKPETHPWIMLDSAMGEVIDARFAPENNGGLHPIGDDCAKQHSYECYLVK